MKTSLVINGMPTVIKAFTEARVGIQNYLHELEMCSGKKATVQQRRSAGLQCRECNHTWLDQPSKHQPNIMQHTECKVPQNIMVSPYHKSSSHHHFGINTSLMWLCSNPSTGPCPLLGTVLQEGPMSYIIKDIVRQDDWMNQVAKSRKSQLQEKMNITLRTQKDWCKKGKD